VIPGGITSSDSAREMILVFWRDQGAGLAVTESLSVRGVYGLDGSGNLGVDHHQRWAVSMWRIGAGDCLPCWICAPRRPPLRKLWSCRSGLVLVNALICCAVQPSCLASYLETT
jgi:hypothetical protein